MKELKKVGAQMNLTVLIYNLKRVANVIGVNRMIEGVP